MKRKRILWISSIGYFKCSNTNYEANNKYEQQFQGNKKIDNPEETVQ